MRPGPVSVGGRARGGVAPAILLDVQTLAGDTYYWADRTVAGVAAVIPPAPGLPAVPVYQPWLLGTGTYSFNRSTSTDTGSVTLQNLSGDVLASDFERIVRKATIEGSLYVLRYYQLDLGFAWLEQHGTLTVGDTSRTSASLKLSQLLQGQDDTPEQDVSETCQLVWAGKRCGATGPTECLYTYSSCQVPVHFVGIQTAFEVNNPEAIATLPVQTVNRKRSW